MKRVFIFLFFLILSGCLAPSAERRDLQSSEVESTPTGSLVSLSESANFIQVNGTKYQETIPLNAGFQDSFLMRGNEIIHYLNQNMSDNQPFCLPLHFTGATKPLLFLELKAQTYQNYLTGKTEHYFKIFPSSTVGNQAACQNANLLNTVNALLGTSYLMSDIAYDIASTCSNCANNILSQNFLSIIKDHTQVLNLLTSSFKIQLIPAANTGGNNSSGPSCLVNETCADPYDCCLNNQCVTDAALKPGIDTSSSAYLTAAQDVALTPSNYRNYPSYYYICPSGSSNDDNGNSSNPNAQAQETLKTLRDLYQCLNPPQDFDLSTCTLKITNASSTIGSSGFVFSVRNDDLNMSSLNPLISNQNITEIDYSGTLLYQKDSIPLNNSHGQFMPGTANDTLSQSQDVLMTASNPVADSLDILRIRYSVLGTCEQVSANIAKCTKIYKQGQVSTPAVSTDHATSQTFALPHFANTSYNMIVKVNDIVLSQDASNWNLVGQNIVFTKPINVGDLVKLTFFVTTDVAQLTASKKTAQAELDTLCGFQEANLEPEINPNTQVIEKYNCITNSSNGSSDPPFQSTVYLNSKTVPHKFFDKNGVYWTPDKIDQAPEQEGSLFEYISSNPLRPNSATTYIGFNEIHGSFKKGATPPLPAQVITVKKNQIYDIYTDSGSFSTCLNCGSDYYSSLQRVFPEIFSAKGAGYEPAPVQTSRLQNQTKYRSDDLLFGRSCFVPATMIPWSHSSGANIQAQRLGRLQTQHFLFANGYNRDWYGFDYGSVIGSWDGVTWFSIGSARRITAKSSKLYLALNAYFGDLTLSGNHKIQIQESLGIPNVGPKADHDTESDGAQCQRYHFCETDQDCIGNLGYDYVCENVNSIKTSWPIIDDQGNEELGSVTKSIASLVGGTNGQSKRCVYRGRGAPCERGNIYQATTSFSHTDKPGILSCSSNNHCAPLTASSYNTKIARYQASPSNQNASSIITDKTDTVGLNARLLGRPYNLIGKEAVSSGHTNLLNQAGVRSLCVPGRTSLFVGGQIENLNQSVPPLREVATDFVGGIGATMESLVTQNQSYYLACPATDDDGQLILKEKTASSLAKLQDYTTSQNISSNLLDHADFSGLNLFNDDGSYRTQIGLDHNACLRAPGASCFSDFDCVGNPWMSHKIRTGANFASLNEAEQDFWKTELICGNPEPKYSDTFKTINEDYQAKNNRCCRDRGLDFTNYSQLHEGSSFISSYSANTPATPAVNQYHGSNNRYTLHQISYEKIKNKADYSALRVPAANPGTPFTLNEILNQYTTLDDMNSRMCCTGHWVRNFDDSNGGNHDWSFSRAQNVSREIFRHLNWLPNTTGDPFKCTILDYETPNCEIRQISEGSTLETTTLAWLEKLELAGIPQIVIDPNASLVTIDDNQAAMAGRPLGYTDRGETLIKEFSSGTTDATSDVIFANDGVNDFFSLNDEDDFGSNLKKVFSDKSFSCCEPAGKTLPSSTTNTMCCTGQAIADTSGKKRCCLNDFTDLSVYLNRYVSSEGSGLANSSYDSKTGYIKNPEVVKQIALKKGLCCSGKVARGVALFNLQIPIFDTAGNPVTSGINQTGYSRRFVSGSSNDANEVFNNAPGSNIGGIYDKGVRWNNHVYCVPKDYQDPY